ncbi:hypothetical protein [Bacillus sp. FJAT-27245]|uniref:hypothetical protein n=1 Tax=Bacillus sp. FJAT-27245 TaxID=1684144 RepID=UPI0006A77940|nr:hypothetical protein [Bacillus sp. FJAT-27245]
MKKYILPLFILTATIFFLNSVIDPGDEKKPKTQAKPLPVPEILTIRDKEKGTLIYQGKKNPKKLSKEQVEKVARDIRPVIAKPFEEVLVSFSKSPVSLSITEWNNGKETKVTDRNLIPAVGAQNVKIFIIRGEWLNDGQATYMAKVRIMKLYSYQDLLSTRTGYYTVVGFFDEEDRVKQMPAKNGKPIDLREVSQPLGHLAFSFPDLAFEKLPAYYFFGNGNAIRFDDFNELETYLKEGLAYTFSGESENWKIELKSTQALGEGKTETAITYIGNGDKPSGVLSLELRSVPLTWLVPGFALDQNGTYESVLNGNQTILKTDSILAVVNLDGKEELIPLEYKEE